MCTLWHVSNKKLHKPLWVRGPDLCQYSLSPIKRQKSAEDNYFLFTITIYVGTGCGGDLPVVGGSRGGSDWAVGCTLCRRFLVTSLSFAQAAVLRLALVFRISTSSLIVGHNKLHRYIHSTLFTATRSNRILKWGTGLTGFREIFLQTVGWLRHVCERCNSHMQDGSKRPTRDPLLYITYHDMHNCG